MQRRAAAALAVGAMLALMPMAASAWAPASSAPVRPGVQLFTDGARCTADFVFSSGGATYLGRPAHCSGTGGATAYNSWSTMQANGETDEQSYAYNDLALVELDPAAVAETSPPIPTWGGLVRLIASGGVGDLGLEIAYARAHGFPDLTLVDGIEPFKGDLPFSAAG